MMAETVLRWSPEHRARSARDIGCCRLMKLSAIRRLIWRAVSLFATLKFVRSILRMCLDPAGSLVGRRRQGSAVADARCLLATQTILAFDDGCQGTYFLSSFRYAPAYTITIAPMPVTRTANSRESPSA
jgi:hypothetical protein